MRNIMAVMGVMAASACTSDARSSTAQAQQAVGAVTTWHTTQNGRQAEANWQDASGGTSVDTWEDRSAGAVTAYVSWNNYVVNPDGSWTSTSAFGQIPATDFAASPDAKTAALHTTMGDSFAFQVCTILPGSYDCTSVPPTSLTLDITWASGGTFHAFSSGAGYQTFAGTTVHFQGTVFSNNATANGFVGGSAIPTGANGYITDSQQTDVERDVVMLR